MGFFSRFATTFDELSAATFVTIRVEAAKQANAKKKEYGELLEDPTFLTVSEVDDLFNMPASEARAKMQAMNTETPAQPKPEAPKAKKPAASKPETSSN